MKQLHLDIFTKFEVGYITSFLFPGSPSVEDVDCSVMSKRVIEVDHPSVLGNGIRRDATTSSPRITVNQEPIVTISDRTPSSYLLMGILWQRLLAFGSSNLSRYFAFAFPVFWHSVDLKDKLSDQSI